MVKSIFSWSDTSHQNYSSGDRLIELINSEQGHAFYDVNFGDIVPLQQSPWKHLYIEAFRLLSGSERHCEILDLGCGAGRFAAIFQKYSLDGYTGIDFSPVRIKKARDYASGAKFIKMNIKDEKCINLFPNFDIFFLLEVLEHIRSDIGIIRSIPTNKTIIFSVPSHESKSHVRFFSSLEEVIGRYGPYMNYEKAVVLFSVQGKRFFIIRGTRNGF